MTTTPHLSRRGLLAGLGAAGGAIALGALAPDATAATPPGGGAQVSPGASPATPPSLPAPIASAPVPGVTYQFRSWQEFSPEVNAAKGRAWGGIGTYTDVSSDYVAAFFDLPPGALLHDLEVYLSNAADVTVYGVTWIAGTGMYPAPYWVQSVAPANTAAHAVRFPVASNLNGPFPHGTRVGVSVLTPTDASVQINGARLGITNAPRGQVVLPNPVRVYDSRTTDGPLAAGQTRTVPLTAAVPAGAFAAVLVLTALKTVTTGGLAPHAPGTPTPRPALFWNGPGVIVSTQITIPLSAAGAVSITGTGVGSAQFALDAVGYLL